MFREDYMGSKTGWLGRIDGEKKGVPAIDGRRVKQILIAEKVRQKWVYSNPDREMT